MVSIHNLQTFLAALPVLLPFIIALSAAVGAFGSALEELGKWRKWPRLISLGQKLEAIGTDIPKLVPQVQVLLLKLQAFLTKVPPAALLMLVLCLGGCSALRGPAVAQVPQDVAVAYAAANAALEVADTVETAYLDSLPAPSDSQLAEAQTVVDDLTAVRAELIAVHDDFANGRDKLRAALADLSKAEGVAKALGVPVPAKVDQAITAASEALK